MTLKGLNLAKFKPAPLPAARIVPVNTKESERIVREAVQNTDAEFAVTDAVLASTPGGATIVNATEENISSESAKLARLVDDDFPFDESQLTAVYGMVQQQYACMIGAAGTGKTTVERKLVDLLQDGLDEIDMSQYWKRGAPAEGDDDYETPEKLIPSILMCSFTGRSTQMTKKNFPREWHGNIMTIHRALGFYPEFYPDYDAESGQMVNKRRFVPAYTAENKMPWDIVVIDEAGMLGLDLWHQLWAAMKDGARIYMIGDIQQLKPTHGHSVLGFALSSWPTWELTHVHRQQGANNSIVDNAHRILKGLTPISDSPKQLSIVPLKTGSSAEKMQPMLDTLTYLTQNKDWRFLTVLVDDDHRLASTRIRQVLKLVHGKIYEPNRDVVITPGNGFEQTASGYSLGQYPMNQALVTMLNPESDRFLIDAGRERQNFAVGDKVMATTNDYEAGITNGMTGIITSIVANGAYVGDTRRWGRIQDVNEYFDSLEEDEDDDGDDFDLDAMVADSQAGMDTLRDKEKKNGGPASHIVTVQFGEGEHGFEMPFNTKSAVASLRLAYVATCHKLQGGEAPLVFGIIHQSNKRMLEREWAYTMVTRASDRCVVFCTRQGLGFSLGKQAIKGKTLKEKIQTFVELSKVGILGASVKVKLPKACSLVTDIAPYVPKEVTSHAKEEEAQPAQEAERIESPVPQQPTKAATKIVVNNITIRVGNDDSHRDRDPVVASRVVDGGELNPKTGRTPVEKMMRHAAAYGMGVKKLSDMTKLNEPVLRSQLGAYLMWQRLTGPAPLLLTHQPAPEPKPVVKPANKFAALLAKQKAAKS